MNDEKIRHSERSLTPRQQQVLSLLRQGLTDEEIGRRISMSPGGVRYHVDNVLRTLGAESRAALVDQPRPRSRPVFPLPMLPTKLIAIAAGVVVLAGVVAAGALLALGGSPDRQVSLGQLAYMVDGDLWVVELPDGEPTRLTHEGTYSSPTWSASGEWISVRLAGSFEGFYVVPAAGGERRLASGCNWSPEEDVLACSSGTAGAPGGVIRIESPEGEVIANHDLTTLLAGLPAYSRLFATCAAWSHDGRYLICDVAALLEGFFSFTGAEGEQYDGIWVVAADGSSAREVIGGDPIARGEYLGSAGWTRDDLALVYARYPVVSDTEQEGDWKDGIEIAVATVTGGEPVAQDVLIVPRASLHGGRTPDGLSAFAEGEGREMWTGKRIAVVDQKSGEATYLTEPAEAAIQPAWSPEYSRIAYVSAPDAGAIDGLDELIAGETESAEAARAANAALAERRIWVMDSDGANKRQITNDPRFRDELPLWSEDGEHILFARIDQAGMPSIWLMNADGSDPTQVAELSPCEGSSCYHVQMEQDYSGPFGLGYYGLVPWFTQFAWWQPTAEVAEE